MKRLHRPLPARAVVGLIVVGLVLPGAAIAKKKKKKKGGEAAPPVGWVQHTSEKNPETNWPHGCYHPPQWDKLLDTDRKMARSTALDAMVEQWGGGRDDGISFGEDVVMTAETVLLGRPHAIEGVVDQNLEHCMASVKGGGSGAWSSWLKALPDKLTVGECPSPPLDYTMFDYLDIGNGWQRQLPICEGDKIRISGTVKDRFRTTDDGPWINVAGDPDKPAVGSEWPCDIEGCFEGTLIMKYTTLDGVETIYAVGEALEFTAPSHGTIEYRINDTSFFDNTWYKSGSIIDHTAIEVSPAP